MTTKQYFNFAGLLATRFRPASALLRATLFAGALALSPGSVVAGQFTFGRAPTQPWSGLISFPLGTRPPQTVDLGPVLSSNWRLGRAKMTADALAFLNERDIGGGFRTSRNQLRLADNGSLFVGTDARGVTLRFVLTGNNISTLIRTPTPIPKIGDPGFQVNFDLEVTIDLDLQGDRLVAGPARIKANVKKPTGTNATGVLVSVVADLVKMVGGPDFVGTLLTTVNSGQFSFQTGINRQLAKFTPFLQAGAKFGTVTPGYNPGTKSVTLTVQKTGIPDVVR